jgi:hypothetical protein
VLRVCGGVSPCAKALVANTGASTTSKSSKKSAHCRRKWACQTHRNIGLAEQACSGGLRSTSALTFDSCRTSPRSSIFETLRRGGYTIHLMRMPPPEHPPEAYCVAIVYKDAEPLVEGTPAPSTRYITIEKTAVEGRVFALCEWDVDGKHKTHGFANHEPTIRDLVANVYAMLGIEAN